MKQWIRDNLKWIVPAIAMLLLIFVSASYGENGAAKSWMNTPLSDATIGDVALIAFGVVLFIK